MTTAQPGGHGNERRLTREHRAEAVGDGEAGVGRQNLTRKIVPDREIEPIAMRHIIRPFEIGAKIGETGFDFNDNETAFGAHRQNIRPPTNTNRRLAKRCVAHRIQQPANATGKASRRLARREGATEIEGQGLAVIGGHGPMFWKSSWLVNALVDVSPAQPSPAAAIKALLNALRAYSGCEKPRSGRAGPTPMTVTWTAFNPAVRVEIDLHDCAMRLARLNDKHQRTAIHLHLSKLQPSRRQEHHKRLATAVFDSLLMRFECRLFRLGSGDLVLVTKNTSQPEIDAPLTTLRAMFADDPLIYHDATGGEGFATTYNVSANSPAFLTHCEALLTEAETRTRGLPSSVHAPLIKQDTRALDMQGLALLDAALATTSIAPFLRQQEVALISAGSEVETVFTELYVSIPDLQRALAPNADLETDPWILLGLMRSLDRRVLAYLNSAEAAPLPRPVSINLCLSGLGNETIDALMRLQSRYRDWRTIIETPHLEPYVDLGGFMQKATRLREIGFRVCLDGFCHNTLPLVDRERLNVDFLKIRWSAALEREGIAAPLERLAGAVKRAGADRVVLCRCDTPGALAWGRSIGIKIFQGRFIDFLHHGAADPRESETTPRHGGKIQAV